MALFEKSSQFEHLKKYLDYSKPDANNLELEQLLEAGSKMNLIIFVNFIMGSMALLAMLDYVPMKMLAGWIALLLLSVMMRIGIALNYQKVQPETLGRWKGCFIAASFLSGLVWGLCGLFIEIYAAEMHHGFEAFILGGMAAGAISTSSSIRWNYPAFMVPMLSILVFNFLLKNDPAHLLMAAMIVFFMIILSIFSLNYRALQFDKQRLLLLATQSLEKLQASEQRLQNITNSMGEGVYVVDKAGALTFINPESEKMLGWSFDELKEDIHAKVHVHDQNNPEECLVKIAYLYKKTMHSDNEQFRRKDGTLFPVSMTASPVQSEAGKEEGTVVLFQDITLQKELEEKLARAALHDALTGLYNRAHFDEKLKDELARVDRYGRSVSLLMLDIDLFKKVNDSYGHQAGDEALKSIATLIASSIRKSDYAARYGGEEFAVILPETDFEKAVELAERIRVAVEQKEHKVSENETIHLTVSIGVGSSSKDIPPELLIKASDTALYRAKESGRNQVVYLDEDA